jgi:hypothetical protein
MAKVNAQLITATAHPAGGKGLSTIIRRGEPPDFRILRVGQAPDAEELTQRRMAGPARFPGTTICIQQGEGVFNEDTPA